VARRAYDVARSRVYVDEDYVWYVLDLTGDRPCAQLPEGLELVRAAREQLPLLEELPTTAPQEALARVDGGADLWLVLADGRPAFSCWIFHDRTPVPAARGGWLGVPADAASLEDSVTAPGFRGRGIAPAAWSGIADALAADGVARLLTIVPLANTPSRRAVEKAGFREFAVMNRRRLGPRRSTTVRGDGPHADELRRALARRG
jgi:GNAT superfamily N-acetyltransferase